LNKLAEQNFDSLFERILTSTKHSPTIMAGVVDLIFAKALQEPKFANLYARLCRLLDQQCPKFPLNGDVVTFKKALLDKCQQEFEDREKRSAQGKEEPSDDEPDDQYEKEKRRTLGNVTFIGELYKETVLPDIVMHICVKSLLTGADAANLEALCVLLTTIGSVFDSSSRKKGEAKTLQGYYGQLDQLSSDASLPSRVRCKLHDLKDLRTSGWVGRPKQRN